jgi:hypothetical protein
MALGGCYIGNERHLEQAQSSFTDDFVLRYNRKPGIGRNGNWVELELGEMGRHSSINAAAIIANNCN